MYVSACALRKKFYMKVDAFREKKIISLKMKLLPQFP